MEGEGSKISVTRPLPCPSNQQTIVGVRSRTKGLKQALVLGVIQILLGNIAFVFQLLANSLFIKHWGYNPGLWCTIFIIHSGAIAIVAEKYKSYALIIAHVIFLSIATLVACVMLGVSIAFMNSGIKDELTHVSVAMCILWLCCSVLLLLSCLYCLSGLDVRLKVAKQRRSSIQLVNRQSSMESNPAAEASSRK